MTTPFFSRSVYRIPGTVVTIHICKQSALIVGRKVREQAFVGTAWYAKKPVTTCLSHRPCLGIDSCMRFRNCTLISPSFIRMRSQRFDTLWAIKSHLLCVAALKSFDQMNDSFRVYTRRSFFTDSLNLCCGAIGRNMLNALRK